MRERRFIVVSRVLGVREGVCYIEVCGKISSPCSITLHPPLYRQGGGVVQVKGALLMSSCLVKSHLTDLRI